MLGCLSLDLAGPKTGGRAYHPGLYEIVSGPKTGASHRHKAIWSRKGLSDYAATGGSLYHATTIGASRAPRFLRVHQGPPALFRRLRARTR